MMEYEKLINIIMDYIECSDEKESAENFCNRFMNTFYDVQDNLENEVSQTIFEQFDDINLICDSYEVNEEIRKADKYCIGEAVLKKKIIKCMEVLQGSDTK